MAITQARMLRLIQAGEQLLSTKQAIASAIAYQAPAIRRGELSIPDAYEQLSLLIQTTCTPTTAEAILAEERIRYDLTHHDNAYRARRATAKRRALGVPPRAPAPSATTTAVTQATPTDEIDYSKPTTEEPE